MKLWFSLLVTLHSSICCWGQHGFVEGQPRLAYWQIGDQKRTVIVLHGGPAVQHEYLRPEFDALKESARVIYYDQRGCGKSDTATSYLWQEQISDLRRVIKTVSKKGKVFLAGSSWGSLLAILYAYAHSEDVKGLILTGTIGWPGKEESYKRDRFHPLKIEKRKMVEKRALRSLTPDGQVSQDTVEVSKYGEVYQGTAQFEPIRSMQSAPKAERLNQLRLPILLFNGKLSQRYDWVDEYKKLFPNLDVHTFELAGHDPWFNDPALFFSVSNDFIRRVSR